MRKSFLLVAALALVSTPVFADDDAVSAEAKTAIEAAVKAAGCSGGEIEKKDYGYKVEEAMCGDDEYDIKLDKTYKITEKEKE